MIKARIVSNMDSRPRNMTSGFSGSNVKRIEEFLRQWQGEATNGRGFTKRGLVLNTSTEG